MFLPFLTLSHNASILNYNHSIIHFIFIFLFYLLFILLFCCYILWYYVSCDAANTVPVFVEPFFFKYNILFFFFYSSVFIILASKRQFPVMLCALCQFKHRHFSHSIIAEPFNVTVAGLSFLYRFAIWQTFVANLHADIIEPCMLWELLNKYVLEKQATNPHKKATVRICKQQI